MLSFYEVDWQDVVRQCYDALRRRNEWYAANGKLVVPTQEPRCGRSTTATTTRCRRPCCWIAG